MSGHTHQREQDPLWSVPLIAALGDNFQSAEQMFSHFQILLPARVFEYFQYSTFKSTFCFGHAVLQLAYAHAALYPASSGITKK